MDVSEELKVISNLNTYKMVIELPLKVAICHQQFAQWFEFLTSYSKDIIGHWEVRPFEGYAHMAGVIKNWSPHIMVIHCHDKWDSSGEPPSPDKLMDVLRVIQRIKIKNYKPLLIGTFTLDRKEFMPLAVPYFDIIIKADEAWDAKSLAKHIWKFFHE